MTYNKPLQNQAFTRDNIEKVIKKYDKKRHNINLQTQKEIIIGDVIQKIESGKNLFNSLQKNILKGKAVYRFKEYSDELIVRKINSNLKSIYNIRQLNRNSIIKRLINHIKEGTPYRVYKLDIKSFYESISRDDIIFKIEKNIMISRKSIALLKKLFEDFANQNVDGLPRGFSLSATISEIVMKEFDKYINDNDNVLFYSRYVDDMIIITTSKEDEKIFKQELIKQLPKGLKLNKKKSPEPITMSIIKNYASDNTHKTFDFLGYEFVVKNPSGNKNDVNINDRIVIIDMANKKVNRNKTKIFKAAKDYYYNKNYNLFLDRLKFLSGNYLMIDFNHEKQFMSGIYYNYQYISIDNLYDKPKLFGFKRLDHYLRNIILSSSSPVNLQNKLNNLEKKKILKISFENGFKNKAKYRFSPKRIEEIGRCWAYD